MAVWVVIAVIGVGFIAGVLSGLVGVGGAVLTTPGIRFLGASPLVAIGSTLPAIIPGSLSGTARYSRARLVDWPIALTAGGSGALLAVVGAWTSDHVNPHSLMLLTAALLGISAWKTSRPARVLVAAGGSSPAEIAEPTPETSRPAVAGIGAGSGFIAGLLGIGGGVVLVPAFTTLLRMPIKRAIASSLVAVAIFSVPAMVTHALLGHINWAYALLLTAGSVPGAQVGSHLTIRGSEARVRRLVGLFLGGLAIVYALRELAELL